MAKFGGLMEPLTSPIQATATLSPTCRSVPPQKEFVNHFGTVSGRTSGSRTTYLHWCACALCSRFRLGMRSVLVRAPAIHILAVVDMFRRFRPAFQVRWLSSRTRFVETLRIGKE